MDVKSRLAQLTSPRGLGGPEITDRELHSLSVAYQNNMGTGFGSRAREKALEQGLRDLGVWDRFETILKQGLPPPAPMENLASLSAELRPALFAADHVHRSAIRALVNADVMSAITEAVATSFYAARALNDSVTRPDADRAAIERTYGPLVGAVEKMAAEIEAVATKTRNRDAELAAQQLKRIAVNMRDNLSDL